MIKKILIANRGEIALRVLRTCKALQIKTVAIYSTVDKNLMHVKMADQSICIGNSDIKKSYLNISAIITAAKISGAEAIHPGYGFLAENATFAESVEKNGIIFIGPSANDIKTMGNKILAIKNVKKAGISQIPWSNGAVDNNTVTNCKIADKIGYPLMIKAAAGGGGKAINIVYKEQDLEEIIKQTRYEASMLFNNDSVYMEKYINNPRHIEFQILSDGKNAIHLLERECSIQRKNQKILEESPSIISKNERELIGKKCTNLCKIIKYRGVAIFEFLYKQGIFYFIEMNTRIQVEHTITEEITSFDLIAEQIKIASGYSMNHKQSEININGHAIECRINAENSKTAVPSPGKINNYHAPNGPGIRVDSHIYSGYVVPQYYDSMIAKVIARGQTRISAIMRLRVALEEMIIEGIDTNISLHQEILKDESFLKRDIHLNYIKKVLSKL